MNPADAADPVEPADPADPAASSGALSGTDGRDELRRYVRGALPEAGAVATLERFETAKLAALAEFAAGAGHEINNPLAVISGRAELLLRDERDPERRRMLAQIGAQALRIRDMIGDLMLFARPPQSVCEPLDLADAVRTVVSRFAGEVPAGVTVAVHADGPVPMRADRTQVCVVVECLLRNSLEALEGLPTPGRIEVECRTQADAGRPAAVLIVRDNGRGLSAADRAHLFDPFYSGRPAGRGLGFGLCKCWRIVTLHGGRIEVESPETRDDARRDAPAGADDGRDGRSSEGGLTAFSVIWPADAHAAGATP